MTLAAWLRAAACSPSSRSAASSPPAVAASAAMSAVPGPILLAARTRTAEGAPSLAASRAPSPPPTFTRTSAPLRLGDLW